MAHSYTDEDTGIVHIEIMGADISLCGLMRGWTCPREKPVKEEYGSTCEGCINELRNLRKILK